MAQMRVKTDGTNLRRTPKIESGNIIKTLPLAQEVTLLSAPAGGFAEVQTSIDGAAVRGFVSSNLLREPVSQPREAFLAEAIKQWIRFNRGEGKETADPFFRFVGEFWQ